VALPSYNEYIQRSHRANARNTLIQAAQWMERAATSTGTYPLTANVPSGILVVEGGRYTAAVASTDGSSYTITATRATGTGQANDKCGDFVIDNANRQTNNNLTGITAAECWSKYQLFVSAAKSISSTRPEAGRSVPAHHLPQPPSRLCHNGG
jgi:type IV pilus assembly protein PilE